MSNTEMTDEQRQKLAEAAWADAHAMHSLYRGGESPQEDANYAIAIRDRINDYLAAAMPDWIIALKSVVQREQEQTP